MAIDFRLMTAAQVGEGGYLILVPGAPDDARARADAVFIERAAFSFLESCLSEVWPAYVSQARKRECRVPGEAWQAFLARIAVLRGELLSADPAGHIGGVCIVMPELRAQAQQQFAQTRAELAQLILALSAWLNMQLPGNAFITLVRL